jgi:hypothetical protein
MHQQVVWMMKKKCIKARQKIFTPTRKRKATEINDQNLNNQMFLSNIRETNENMLTYSTKKEVLEFHGISADLRSTTICMQGKQLIGTARGETNLPANDMRLALTNATGNVTDEDEFYNIEPVAILKSNTIRDPICWVLTLATVFYAKNFTNPNFEMSNKGQPIKPDTTVISDPLPSDSSLITEFYNWLTMFQEFCKRHRPKAWSLWNKSEYTFPVLLSVEELSRYMEERNFHGDGIIYSKELMFSIIHDCAVEKIKNSRANATHFNILGWLNAMVRQAASKVPLLHNKLQSIPFYSVTLLKSEIINHFRQLTDIQKMKVGRAFPCLEIAVGQTLRQLLELLINIIQALKRLGCKPSDQMQKYIYLQAFYLVYDNKYISETQSYIFNSLHGLADVVIACEALLTKSNKNPTFQLQYLVKNKAQRLSPMEELLALLKDKSISAHPAFNSNSNANCKNPECNLKGPSMHVPFECWIKFPNKMPQRLKDIKSKSSSNNKFNSNSVNQSKNNSDKWKMLLIHLRRRLQKRWCQLDNVESLPMMNLLKLRTS